MCFFFFLVLACIFHFPYLMTKTDVTGRRCLFHAKTATATLHSYSLCDAGSFVICRATPFTSSSFSLSFFLAFSDNSLTLSPFFFSFPYSNLQFWFSTFLPRFLGDRINCRSRRSNTHTHMQNTVHAKLHSYKSNRKKIYWKGSCLALF